MMLDAVGSITTRLSSAGTGGAGAAAPAAVAKPAGGTPFGEVLADVSSQAVGTLKTAEATAITGIEGRSSVQHVVQAVMAAEQTLQTALAVRDKVVAAYQEISRLSI
ncbi:flagellar hook-basal body complex protein FliE [Prosthecomicrobium pneumaticum]|uniref:Flagellar hook-basal body complex protein FliE n=1 Tax=Prosthecomicrobium pneumaticum TaxID=81895 RepID=A0A7W9CSX5_9HYPH|nr:flagellar hook-basal body complex protein FliE [Prosthecomicrobium pneumaticum]MBB5751024.1 flagellar hook-basal body complex protein FliE [Prosthecomicrobium pneumaticum]